MSQATASWRRSYFLCRQKKGDGGGVHERVPDSSFSTELWLLVCGKKQQKGEGKRLLPTREKSCKQVQSLTNIQPTYLENKNKNLY
jgi:hypothetical protein